MNTIKVVGVDPALRNWGVCQATVNVHTLDFTIDDLKLLKTTDEAGKTVRKNSDDLRRAEQLYRGFQEVCEGAALCIAEVPVGSQSARAMASYGICIGVLSACPIPLIQVMPTEVKVAAIGEKHAAKEEVIEAAVKRFPDASWLRYKRSGKLLLANDNEHLADAVFAIAAGIQTTQFKQAIRIYQSMREAA